jgi:hypothetical protein
MRIKHLSLDRIMHILLILCILGCLYPLVFTPIHGDELISPFVFISAYDGSFINYFDKFSLETDGHFNFLGEIIGVAWLATWTRLFSEYNSVGVLHFAYYVIKTLCIIGFLLIAFRLSKQNNSNFKNRSHFIIVLMSFCIVSIYHVNWSSDPVGNYPLVGYFSASIGGLFIILLTSKVKLKTFLIFLLLLVSIFYYEMNLSLIFVLIYYLRKKIGKLRMVLVAAGLIVLSIFYQSILTTDRAYTGGEFLLSPKIITSFFIQISSVLPLTTLPLAIYFSNWIIFVFVIYLALGIIYKSKFQKVTKEFLFGTRLGIIRRGIESLTEVEKLLLVYFIMSSLVFSFTNKYQNEIRLPGQVYMSYSTGQLFAVVLISKFLVRYIHSRTFLSYATVGCLLLIPLIQNNLMVEVLKVRTAYSQELLESWNYGEESRCKALSNWLSYDWDRDYLLAMKNGIESTYLKLNKEQFCTADSTHPERRLN